MKLTGIVKYIKQHNGWHIFYVRSGNNINKYFDELEHYNDLHIPILYNKRLDRLFKIKDKHIIHDIKLIIDNLYYISMKSKKIYSCTEGLVGVYLRMSSIEDVNLHIDDINKKVDI